MRGRQTRFLNKSATDFPLEWKLNSIDGNVYVKKISWIAPGIRRRSVLSTAEPDEAGCVPRFPCFPEGEVRARIFRTRRRHERRPHVLGPERRPEVVLP